MGFLDRFWRDDDEPLRLDELMLKGGTWNGLLFENPSIGLEPWLSWSFNFEFEEVELGDEAVDPTFDLEWVELPGASWQAMAGLSASSPEFCKPIEASAYVFEHYRYDQAELRVVEQHGARLRVTAGARVDLDGLGIPEWSVDGQLEFTGIYVQLEGVDTVEVARERLSAVTDVAGLEGRDNGHNVLFVTS